MLTLISRKPLIVALVFLAFIILILILPLKFEYRLKVQGKLLPEKEWIISKGTDGRLTTLLTNYKTGLNQSYDVTLFDRGDAMQFAFDSKLQANASVKKGDTIAVVYSNEIDRQIENLKGQIMSAKSSLYLNLTGEKEAVIDEVKNSLSYAIKQTEEQKKIVDRLKALYERGLTSQEEYEIAKGTYDLFEINILIAKARLQSVETGTKPEQVEFVKSQIIALEKELSVLKKRFEGFTLLSPISGTINRITNSDTLMIISDTTEYILISPIRIQDKKFIKQHQKVDVFLNGKKQKIHAWVSGLDNNTKVIQGVQTVTAISFIQGKTEELIPNLMVDCYIYTGNLPPLDFLQRMWERMVN